MRVLILVSMVAACATDTGRQFPLPSERPPLHRAAGVLLSIPVKVARHIVGRTLEDAPWIEEVIERTGPLGQSLM
ncbi:MAG: hypothetical protein Q7T01_00785 [bacterium]|nr:hypothetical protein [bacterium]